MMGPRWVFIDIVIVLLYIIVPKPLYIILDVILNLIVAVIVEATYYTGALKWMDLDIHSASG